MLFFSFAEEALKGRKLNHHSFNQVQFVFNSSEKLSKFKLNQVLRNAFTDCNFSEQFEIVCVPEELLTRRSNLPRASITR